MRGVGILFLLDAPLPEFDGDIMPSKLSPSGDSLVGMNSVAVPPSSSGTKSTCLSSLVELPCTEIPANSLAGKQFDIPS